jgi:hypothetical protein
LADEVDAVGIAAIAAALIMVADMRDVTSIVA